MDAENAAVKQRGRPFLKGRSGNPGGKRKGTRNRSTLAAEALLEGEAQALTRKAINMALEGDTTALRLCLERLMPPRKDRTISLALPPIASTEDAAQAVAAVLTAVSKGEITISEGDAVVRLIEACSRTLVTDAPPPIAPTLRIAFVSKGEDGSMVSKVGGLA